MSTQKKPAHNYQTLVQENYRRLSQTLPGFIPRREQNYLVAEIGKVLLGRYDKTRRMLVAEAGTGIGKSLAYLQAAIPWARANQKKVIISTATLALQEQLVDKDLPLFLPYCKPSFRFALAKGRARYCCARRLADLANGAAQTQMFEAGTFESTLLSAPLTATQETQLAEMWQAYQNKSWQGDRDSWPTPIDQTLWQQLQAERHSCQPMLGHQQCPFHQARAELEHAEVIVVNHALLLADLSMGGGIVLPEPEQCVYILDEAHHIANVARDQGSIRLSLRQLRRSLEQFNKWQSKLNDLLGTDGQSAIGRLQHSTAQLIPALTQVYQPLFSALQRQELTTDDQGCLRFNTGDLPCGLDELLSIVKEDSQTFCRALGPINTQLADQLKINPSQAPAIEAALAIISQQQLQGEQIRDGATLLLRAPGPKQTPPARWLALDAKDNQEIILCATPLAVGHLLEQWCWSRAAAVIMTSATLTALNDFGYFRRAVGLRQDDGSHYIRLNSPFSYAQSQLIIPDLACEPNHSDFNELLATQIPFWLKEQQASLVLFSSYRQMQHVAAALRAKGHSLLVQGEASRQALLQLHKDKCDGKQPSILFGTGSFSEGLDLPGHYLTNLIITKLPFAVPTSPVEEAMAEWITLCGGNPFMQLALPEASRKLIQACGRLLRTETDTGRIVLLDKRLVSKRYGPALLQALPPFNKQLHGKRWGGEM
ncbi:MAG: ATP-dependent DNA helicase DinG [Oceanisphaera sp.]|uniref:ATP-dependent DNA helicase DinG n=1 Tax=Oceanisphaera sp. TaxID=1929979 RepID=UPI003F99E482